jgi:hypothetical protein
LLASLGLSYAIKAARSTMGHSFPAAWVQGRGHRGSQLHKRLSCSEGQAVTGGCTKCGCGEFHELDSSVPMHGRREGCDMVWTGAAYMCSHRREWSIGRKEMPLRGFPVLPSSTTTHQALWQPTRCNFLPLGRIRSFKPSSRSPPDSLSLGACCRATCKGWAKQQIMPLAKVAFIPTKPCMAPWNRCPTSPSTDHSTTALIYDLSTQL